ncbi:potassium channel [Bordetella pertussis]|nr:potassium channel [Bordetella pertussis]
MIRLRNFLRRIGRYFPPNWWLAALVAIDGYLFVRPVLGRAVDYPMDYWLSFDSWRDAMDAVGLLQIPRVILGAGLLLMAAGLVLKARIAWAFSLVLLGAIGVVAGGTAGMACCWPTRAC